MRGGTVAWLGASALALLIASVAVRAAALRALPADHALVTLLAPDNPRAVLDSAERQILTAGGRIDPVTRTAAIAAATTLPLDERPYLVAAIDALSAGREADGVALLERARRLNGRQRVVRLLLMDRYLRSGRTREATGEIAAVDRLLPAAQTALAPELAKLLRDPASRAATRASIAANPDLFDATLAHLARTGTAPATLAAIAGSAAPSGLGPAGWRSALIQTQVAAGKYAEARRSWQQAHRLPAGDGLIFDPGFTGRAAPPFGWELVSNEVGSAERTADGLGIEYFGRRAGPLASQLIVAPPGRYRLSFAMEGSDGGEVGSVAVTLQCAGSTPRELATLPAPKLGGGGPKRAAMDLTVPAGCGAQWLRIVGLAREFASPTSATLSQLSLARVG